MSGLLYLYGLAMDSGLQKKNHQALKQPGVKQPGKKKQKRRGSSRLSVYIYPRCHKTIHNYDEDREGGCQRRGPIRIRFSVLMKFLKAPIDGPIRISC
ncbi:hypothetical protein AVEN_264028-1 [Araneus ventricosus]|uniref:Uncharacterized protein n=1 Tax=Araneus ventricosus TaxID=182803 RepID=A0A4Y2UGR6_ARAVE|nr:hypothetical protein AVEN_264028-1 [Araneus ventricosus]